MSEIIDEIVKTGLAPVLKAEGYRKTARTFRMAGSDFTKIVNVQASSWNSIEDGKLTINLGVFFPAVAVLHDQVTFRHPPRECDCLVQERIGFLMPEARDFWWEVRQDSNLPAIAEETVKAWREFGKPWLEEHTDLRHAQSFVLQRLRLPFIAAMFGLARGDRVQAGRLIRQAVAECPEGKDRLLLWAAKHRLNIPSAV